MADDNFTIEWHDAGKEPRCPPNPDYPDGKDLDARLDDTVEHCTVDLPYPAKRIGHFVVTCLQCGMCVACTTAGRADDPRSIAMNCRDRMCQT